MKFLVNGSIAFDILLGHNGSFLHAIDPKKLDRLSINYLTETYARHHGGTAANIGWNLCLLGATPMLVSAVGFDGAEYLSLLSEKGADISHVNRISDAVTAMALIATDSDERQISFFHPGADPQGTFPELRDLREEISYAIMSPRNPLLMLKGAEECRKAKIPYLFDPGQVVFAFGDDELKRVVTGSAGLVANEYEWDVSSAKLGWKEKDVVEACGMLVITLGDKGLSIHTKEGKLTIPACKAERVINPTGAGDAVRAGLLYGLASKWSLTYTGQLAAILGCLVVEQEGTLLPSLDIATIQERAMENYCEKLPIK